MSLMVKSGKTNSLPYVSFRFETFSLGDSSTDPMEDKEVEEAEAVGESPGVLGMELAAVEGAESTTLDLIVAPLWARAVVVAILLID